MSRSDEKHFEELLRRGLESGREPSGEHASPEILAAWHEGALTDAERASWDTHLASCASCQEEIAALARIEGAEHPAPPWWRRLVFPGLPAVRWAAAGATAVIALSVAIRLAPEAERQVAEKLASGAREDTPSVNAAPDAAPDAVRDALRKAAPETGSDRDRFVSGKKEEPKIALVVPTRAAEKEQAAPPPAFLERKEAAPEPGGPRAKAVAPAPPAGAAKRDTAREAEGVFADRLLGAAESAPAVDRPAAPAPKVDDRRRDLEQPETSRSADEMRAGTSEPQPASPDPARAGLPAEQQVFAPQVLGERREDASPETGERRLQRLEQPTSPPADEARPERGGGLWGWFTGRPEEEPERYMAPAAREQYRAGAGDNVVRIVPPPRPIVIASRTQLWRLGDHGRIERSTDGGTSWTRQASGVETNLLGGTCPAERMCWVVGAAGTILRTTDGETWERVDSPTREDLVHVSASDGHHAIVASSAGNQFRTDDGAASWRPVSAAVVRPAAPATPRAPAAVRAAPPQDSSPEPPAAR